MIHKELQKKSGNVLDPKLIVDRQKASAPLTWIEISKRALDHNISNYRSLIKPGVLFVPVIKSNAYGHGMLAVGSVLQDHTGVDGAAVVAITEGIALRENGFSKKIIVLGIIDADLHEVVRHDLELVVYDRDVINQLNEIAKNLELKVRIHIKIDTGLSRLGFFPDQAFETIKAAVLLPHVEIIGISTHFANSESKEDWFVNLQLSRFNELINKLRIEKINIPLQHTTCTAALGAYEKAHGSLVRFGMGLYGLWPSQENKDAVTKKVPNFSLLPVLKWKTRIIQLKNLPAGSFVGYDLTHQVQQETKIAVLPVGFWDGLDRGLSNKGSVMIRDIVAPIIGRIAMNLCMIDVSHVPGVSVGDEVILIGEHEAVSADAMARHIGTINYEVVTRINPLAIRSVTE
ncbi:MAG TPA: alanine racemase [Candidatus Babeliales bacterium]|nr:alanine racemase [Candidatus Babeliales bacterium]